MAELHTELEQRPDAEALRSELSKALMSQEAQMDQFRTENEALRQRVAELEVYQPQADGVCVAVCALLLSSVVTQHNQYSCVQSAYLSTTITLRMLCLSHRANSASATATALAMDRTSATRVKHRLTRVNHRLPFVGLITDQLEFNSLLCPGRC